MKRATSDFMIGLPPQGRTIFQALLAGHFVSTERLIFALYADRIDESPLDAAGVVTVKVWELRKALKPHGIRIESRYGMGYRISPTTVKEARALAQQTTLPHVACPHCGSLRLDA